MGAAMTQENICEKRTYLVKEVAQILGISENAAYVLVKEQEEERIKNKDNGFRSVRIGTSIRVSKVSFDKWLDEQGL